MDRIISQFDLVYIITHYAFKIRFNIIHPACVLVFSLHSRIFIIAILFGDIFILKKLCTAASSQTKINTFSLHTPFTNVVGILIHFTHYFLPFGEHFSTSTWNKTKFWFTLILWQKCDRQMTDLQRNWKFYVL